MRIIALVVAAALLAAGCGQRGPLYLRDKPPPGVKPPKPAAYQPVPYPADAERDAENKN
jgi:predicted small lipoprotein YifL